MKKAFFVASLLGSLMFGYSSFASNEKNFTLFSKNFKDNEALNQEVEFNGMGCVGKNKSPQLNWKNAPKDTKSFAITVYDPDAPTGSGWWHYVAYNISSKTRKIINLNNLPEGSIISENDGATKDFMGPCPPVGHGTHHYIFTIYALDIEKLDLPQNASAAHIGYMINHHKIAAAKITGIYERK